MGDRKERELKLKDEIRQRLAVICSNLSPREFDELIDKIAENQLKGEYRPYRLASASPMVAHAKTTRKAPPLPRRGM